MKGDTKVRVEFYSKKIWRNVYGLENCSRQRRGCSTAPIR